MKRRVLIKIGRDCIVFTDYKNVYKINIQLGRKLPISNLDDIDINGDNVELLSSQIVLHEMNPEYIVYLDTEGEYRLLTSASTHAFDYSKMEIVHELTYSCPMLYGSYPVDDYKNKLIEDGTSFLYHVSGEDLRSLYKEEFDFRHLWFKFK